MQYPLKEKMKDTSQPISNHGGCRRNPPPHITTHNCHKWKVHSWHDTAINKKGWASIPIILENYEFWEYVKFGAISWKCHILLIIVDLKFKPKGVFSSTLKRFTLPWNDFSTLFSNRFRSFIDLITHHPPREYWFYQANRLFQKRYFTLFNQ